MVINGNTEITSLGIYLPEQKVSSISLMEEIQSESRFGIPHNWVDRRVGISERRMAISGTMPSELAIKASYIALERANLAPDNLDMIIYCGIEKDYIEPSTAHVIQRALESNAVCMDVMNACQGMINGIITANAFITSGQAETVLICSSALTSEVMREFIRKIKNNSDDYLRDRLGILTCGDAGSAVILSKKQQHSQSGLQKLLLDSKGEYAEYCYYRYVQGEIEGQMLMKGMTDVINNIHLKMISNTYHYLDWTPKDVDYLVCHQVGKKSQIDLCNISEVPIERAPSIYEKLGNITTCSIPVTLEYINPKKGDKILLMGGGSGLSSFQGGLVW